MPRVVPELSAAEVRRIDGAGCHGVGGVPGLMLQVTRTGGRSWILRTMVGKKRREIGLGGFPAVSLADARQKAREMRELIQQGIDPVEQRKAARQALIDAQARSITFDDAAKQFLAGNRYEFRNPKHAAQWESTLRTYASPVIGDLAVDTIELPHILQILKPIWTTKTETASRLRGRIEAVLAWATVGGYRGGENPARWKGHLDAVLPKPSRVAKVRHHRALPLDDVGEFMAALRKRKGIAARALEFLVLSAARSGEVRGATWDEIDIESRLWTVPGERMKAGREHRVPLSDAAVALLKALPRREDSSYVF